MVATKSCEGVAGAACRAAGQQFGRKTWFAFDCKTHVGAMPCMGSFLCLFTSFAAADFLFTVKIYCLKGVSLCFLPLSCSRLLTF